ncbi:MULTISPECIES: single-stranded-DNA-specific exonuclease RecJ [Sphingopyxis]|uniref:Single-stranded-DNA-specific exonuclease RecJ n=1 Tax=Sphingopyxis granuli TaxID=267128 RepID=A0AA86GNM7_9SPHN|nr:MULTISPECIES: single-stranded-DNA-specific exonuclease RecJ [Sphingopyxis]AMG76333.1 Single-stranded-DNA-specific exonuclease RecJ [Sphingopyxis granuli]AVA15227.1 single-stranded-DNA-specific exonuclease RecJ [Sphingopyxis sp. MG]ODU30017.1 MAG: single-stranded-DNA-specific exonuclease RecJ [Sphingopyxis sp. SCN 67-31]
MTDTALGIAQSILGQPWRWRRTSAQMGGESLAPDDLVTQLLLARGVPRDDIERQRAPTLRAFMPDPSLFRDMDAAAARLADAVEAREAVTVFGDYDVDGATSAALLVRLLRALDVPVGAYIPDRLMEGYGPSGAALVRIGAAGSRLVVTVDCGAQAFDAIAEAKAAGVEVIVVDHHQCATTLPQAFAVVNPNRLDEAPDAALHGNLAAVGVAFLLGAALLRTLRARGFFGSRPEPALIDLLDLVALGTVADVARLTGFNRALVTQGLKVMARRGNIGLAALMDAARLTKPPTASDMGFALGPRINAGGRVGKSDLGVRLLTTSDPQEAADIAQELNHLNDERRAIEAAVLDQAIEASIACANAPVALVAASGWHPGVIGIVAGRLKERLHRPAIVVALGDDGIGKGSGRSIAGVDLGAAVLAAKETGLLVAGGGHAMAAGLTVAADRIDALGAFLSDRLAADVERASGDKALLIDAVLAPRGISPLWCEAIDSAGPYGAGWPAPRVATGPVRIVEAGIVGTDHLRLIVAGDDGARFKAIAFRSAEGLLGQTLLHARGGRKLWLAGRAKRDDWGSRPAAELHLEDAAWAD